MDMINVYNHVFFFFKNLKKTSMPDITTFAMRKHTDKQEL